MISRRQIIEGQQEFERALLAPASAAAKSGRAGAERWPHPVGAGRGSRWRPTEGGKSVSQMREALEQRTRLIRGHQDRLGPQVESGRSGPFARLDAKGKQQQQQQQQQLEEDDFELDMGEEMGPFGGRRRFQEEEEDDDEEELYDLGRGEEATSGGHCKERSGPPADYRHFDPYSVYGEEDEEEDVWYSEERLFEVSEASVFS